MSLLVSRIKSLAPLVKLFLRKTYPIVLCASPPLFSPTAVEFWGNGFEGFGRTYLTLGQIAHQLSTVGAEISPLTSS